MVTASHLCHPGMDTLDVHPTAITMLPSRCQSRLHRAHTTDLLAAGKVALCGLVVETILCSWQDSELHQRPDHLPPAPDGLPVWLGAKGMPETLIARSGKAVTLDALIICSCISLVHGTFACWGQTSSGLDDIPVITSSCLLSRW